MLVLTRKTKQQIQIGPHITITILQVKGQAVRVGIEAPKDVSVLRTELAERMSDGTYDPTVRAAAEKFDRESEISSRKANEEMSDRTMVPVSGSSRCRAPRVDVAPVDFANQSTGPASSFRPRRRRLSMQ